MITFFRKLDQVYAVESTSQLPDVDLEKLSWLFGDAERIAEPVLGGSYTGPRREMVTPWSTNAVEITQNMGIRGISRIEEFKGEAGEWTSGQADPHTPIPPYPHTSCDPMLQQRYEGLDQHLFTIGKKPDPVIPVTDIAAYNQQEGLALSGEEIGYLEELARRINRHLTDSEVFGFSQVNSEHCRHKIFNGTFIIDGQEMPDSLFQLIKKTSKENPGLLVSAYKDNVAFIMGPAIEQFAPGRQDLADFFCITNIESVISLKAETHNFPTTVEPFNGAATGSGGEIRDRMAGGKGSIPMAGTAVYMTSYPRLEGGRSWEKEFPARKWLYKNPEDLLIKASNGASDFGNKFGQPLICGSVLTFEHQEGERTWGFDKVIMLAGGIGFARKEDSLKEEPRGGEKVVILGGDNYRIGMGGGAVSSVATGEYGNAIELNAVQRSNPEMQKRVFNAIRALTEMGINPVVSIHDHGAGGHLNSISELVEATGGTIRIDALPVGDPTLSDKEILSNESQERMGLLIREHDLELLEKIAARERAPIYVAGEATGDHQFIFENRKNNTRPIDLQVEDFFGKPPKTVMVDERFQRAVGDPPSFRSSELRRIKVGEVAESRVFQDIIKELLQIEAVACKDWLTNKVDRAVSGKIAMQQTCGEIQLPLNNLGVVALDYQGGKGIATSLGHAPAAALIDPVAGSRLAIAEALTNLVWAPLTHGLKGVSLSANWMWPCRNPGEDARLYDAVKAVSDFAIELGINIPTGKDSLSMTQKYPGGSVVYSPGTVIISAVAEVEEVRKTVSPVVVPDPGALLVYLDLSGSPLSTGGSSFDQIHNRLGETTPDVADAGKFARRFEEIQQLIRSGRILAGHDISSGGMITALLEMNFPNVEGGMEINLDGIGEPSLEKILFAENPGVLLQINGPCPEGGVVIGHTIPERTLSIQHGQTRLVLDIDEMRDAWFRTSALLDRKQSGEKLALERFENYKLQPLRYRFPERFSGKAADYGIELRRRNASGIRAAIIREKGVNRDRDMAWAMYLAGFDVKDIHMTDLISGRETLEDVSFIAFVGGFSNSDVLGSAKGWAGSFLFNERAKKALENFYARPDTLSLGVCNGCQLMVELGLLYPEHNLHPKMSWNDSHKYECAFINLTVMENHSVMFGSLAGARLGVWTAHGEGKFNFPYQEAQYHIPAKFSYHGYPANPNGSMFDAACVASADGRHLAIMPHIEDSVLPWQWAHYPGDRKDDEVTPWIEAFVNARRWIQEKAADNC